MFFLSLSLAAQISIYTGPSYAVTAEQWSKTYGGTSSEEAYSIEQTSDNGYIVAGYTTSFGAGNEDMWVLKLDSSGNIQWQKTYGGADSDWANSIQQTSDGGYIVAGVTYSFGSGGSADMWVLKLDDNGTVQWQKTYGGADSDFANSVQQTGDGGYIVAGVTYSFGMGGADIWVLKLTANGDTEWEGTYGGTGNDYANSVQQTNDGGYIIAGDSDSFSATRNIWILKLDAAGNSQWQASYGGDSFDFANSVQQTSDGGYIVAGYTWSIGAGNEDVWVIKLNSSGYVQWQYTYGGPYNDWAYSIKETGDGGYVVAGVTYSFGATNGYAWTIKLNRYGIIQWQYAYGGSNGDGAYTLHPASDSGYIVAGVTYSFGAVSGDFWLLKLSSEGSIVFDNATLAKIKTTTATPLSSRISANIISSSPVLNNNANITNTTSVEGQTTTATVGSQKNGVCVFTLSPSSITQTPIGGNDNISLTSSLPGCSWTVTNPDPSWITLTSANSGTGSAVITYSFSTNTGTQRAATLVVAGKPFTVSQDGCSYSISPTTQSVAPAGGTGSITVSGNSNCNWEVTSIPSWVTINSGSTGKGNGTVNYSVSANQVSGSRAASMTVAGQTFALSQEAACSYSISPISQSVSLSGGTGSISVTTSAGNCAWTATRNDSWITITSGSSGTGNGTVNYSVSARSDGGPQTTGTITIAGQTFTLTQSSSNSGQATSVTPTPTQSGQTSTTPETTAPSTPAAPATPSTPTPSTTTSTGGGQTPIGTETSQTPAVTQVSVCTYTISSSTQDFKASGGAGSISVIPSSDTCGWIATSGSTWISITSSGNGSGSGSINYSVSPNTGEQRTGSLTIGGQTLIVNQEAVPCTYSISPANKSFTSLNGMGTVIVTAYPALCVWEATANDPWITLNFGTKGSGSGMVNYSVAANTESATRIGTLTVAGLTLSITQEKSVCNFSFSSPRLSFDSSGGTGTIALTVSAANCDREAASNTEWITLTSGGGEKGSGSVAFSVSPNLGPARTGSFTIGGRTFTVTQGSECIYTASSANQSFSPSGGAGTIDLKASGNNCRRDAASNADWITITSGNKETGSGTIKFSVMPNTGPPRTGTLAVGGQTVTVAQSSDCTYSISPTSQSFNLSGGNGTFKLTASANSCGWDATGNADWITITSGTGNTGTNSVNFSVALNSGPPRTGTIAVAGQTFTVTQGSDCTYSISPTSQSFNRAGGAGNISVKASTNICSRDAASSEDWITITSGSGETGSGIVMFSVSPNEGPSRTGTMTVAGQTFTVSQGSDCDYSLSPTSQAFDLSGGSGSIDVKPSGDNCSWNTTDNSSWINIISGSGGSGKGKVKYSVSPNTGIARSGKINIAGKSFAVTQEGCTYVLSQKTQAFNAAGGSASVNIKTSQKNCDRDITTKTSWINIVSGKIEAGSGTVFFSVSPNTGPARTGTINIADQVLTVNQDAARAAK